MKFEVKTDQKIFSDKFSFAGAISFFTFITLLLVNISINLSKLSRFYEINYLCNLVLVDKSSNNFRKLSRLIKQPKKQKLWDFCREFTK
tara:strand:+ start:125 stop:391 length:267 start_codon:yes stop_codon:yes gene_type:complete